MSIRLPSLIIINGQYNLAIKYLFYGFTCHHFLTLLSVYNLKSLPISLIITASSYKTYLAFEIMIGTTGLVVAPVLGSE
jgi:hypothetical protein